MIYSPIYIILICKCLYIVYIYMCVYNTEQLRSYYTNTYVINII